MRVCIYMNIYTYTQRISNLVRIVINLKVELAFLCIVTESIPVVTDVVMNLNEQVWFMEYKMKQKFP